MIGYIDFLGVFRCDVDPQNTNGYLAEDIDEETLLLKFVHMGTYKVMTLIRL